MANEPKAYTWPQLNHAMHTAAALEASRSAQELTGVCELGMDKLHIGDWNKARIQALCETARWCMMQVDDLVEQLYGGETETWTLKDDSDHHVKEVAAGRRKR